MSMSMIAIHQHQWYYVIASDGTIQVEQAQDDLTFDAIQLRCRAHAVTISGTGYATYELARTAGYVVAYHVQKPDQHEERPDDYM
jgi:hypothetical protein